MEPVRGAPTFHWCAALERRAWLARTRHAPLFLLALYAAIGGCASSGAPGPAAPSPGEAREPAAISTEASVVTREADFSVSELFARALAALAAARYGDARTDYELLLSAELSIEERQRALFGLATALDLLGENTRALERYVDAARAEPSSETATESRVRAARLAMHEERFVFARELVEAVDLADVSPRARIAVHAARALGALTLGDLTLTEREIARGRGAIEDAGLEQAPRPPLDVAALYYARGELLRLRAEALDFSPPPADFPAALEARCQLVLDAQSAYSETMRAEDARWSAMAGVRVGQLYQRLHADLLAIPAPAAATTPEKQALFEAAMRLRYAILLEKAARMMQTTVTMLERTGEQGPWQKKAEAALSELEAAKVREAEALGRLPYSRAELQRVLEDLDRRGGGSGKI